MDFSIKKHEIYLISGSQGFPVTKYYLQWELYQAPLGISLPAIPLNYLFSMDKRYSCQWWIQDFPEVRGGGGCANPQREAVNLLFNQFFPKKAWKQESPPAWTQEAYCPPCSEYLTPPLLAGLIPPLAGLTLPLLAGLTPCWLDWPSPCWLDWPPPGWTDPPLAGLTYPPGWTDPPWLDWPPPDWTDPPPVDRQIDGQTHVKTLPSHRTTYAGGNEEILAWGRVPCALLRSATACGVNR